jgi:hypothetical protein
VFNAAGVRLLSLFQPLLSTGGIIVDRNDQLAAVVEYTFEEVVDVVR